VRKKTQKKSRMAVWRWRGHKNENRLFWGVMITQILQHICYIKIKEKKETPAQA
jgi:hypothetical protein